MKSFLFIIVFISGTAFTQTNVIAAKSHSCSPNTELNEPDNFGENIMPRVVKSVTYLKEGCIVETYVSQWNENDLEHDTICDHPFLQPSSFDLERLKEMYPDKTKFEGFGEIDKANRKASKKIKKEKKEKSFGLIFFLIGGGLFMIYLFFPKLSLNKA